MTLEHVRVENLIAYNFEKWSGHKGGFGDGDFIPLSIADMDFKAPKPVIERLTHIAKCGIYANIKRPDSYFNAIINWMEKRH